MNHFTFEQLTVLKGLCCARTSIPALTPPMSGGIDLIRVADA